MVLSQLVGLVGLGFAGYIGLNSWRYYDQYRNIAALDPTDSPELVPGETVTLNGLMKVIDPSPVANISTDSTSNDGNVGLFAWRILRRKRSGFSISGEHTGRRSRWATEDGGLEVGTSAVATKSGTTMIDSDAVRGTVPDQWDPSDPWEVTRLHLGDPDEDVSLTDTSKFGSGNLIDIDIGPINTGESARFQTSQAAEDDWILVHGKVVETDDGLTVTDGPDTPLVVAIDSMNDLPGRLLEKIAYNAFFALILVVLAVAAFSGFISF